MPVPVLVRMRFVCLRAAASPHAPETFPGLLVIEGPMQIPASYVAPPRKCMFAQIVTRSVRGDGILLGGMACSVGMIGKAF